MHERWMSTLMSVASITLMSGATSAFAQEQENVKPAIGVTGRYILTIGDGDMDAESYATGLLPRLDSAEAGEAGEDLLTVLELPIREPQTPFAQMPVSNSSWGPPNMLAVTGDGRFAYIAESRGSRHLPNGKVAERVDELPPGEVVSVVDMSDPLKPRLAGTQYVGPDPTAVAVREGDDFLAVVSRRPGQELMVARLKDGLPQGDTMAWPLLGLDGSAAPACVAWRPDGRVLAVTLPERDEVAFFEFTPDIGDGEMGLAPYGKGVHVEGYPYSCAFTPDGEYLVVACVHWGPRVEGYFVGAPPGTVSVIRLSSEGGPRVVATASVGISPQGLAVRSTRPGSAMIVTSNLQRSFLSERDPRVTKGGSLSVLALDLTRGTLDSVAELPLSAMPEGVTFDAGGKYVIVTQYRSFDPSVVDGELAFFRVTQDAQGRSTLTDAELFVGVGKNPHGVVIVR